jgi:hypothetical protein
VTDERRRPPTPTLADLRAALLDGLPRAGSELSFDLSEREVGEEDRIDLTRTRRSRSVETPRTTPPSAKLPDCIVVTRAACEEVLQGELDHVPLATPLEELFPARGAPSSNGAPMRSARGRAATHQLREAPGHPTTEGRIASGFGPLSPVRMHKHCGAPIGRGPSPSIGLLLSHRGSSTPPPSRCPRIQSIGLERSEILRRRCRRRTSSSCCARSKRGIGETGSRCRPRGAPRR